MRKREEVEEKEKGGKERKKEIKVTCRKSSIQPPPTSCLGMTRHIFSTSAPQKREILLMLTWECQTCIHSVLLVIDVVKYCRPNMTTVVFRQHHQFCHRRRPILLVLTQLELSLKEPIFYSFQQSKPSRAIIDKYFIHSTALYCYYCTVTVHCTVVPLLYCDVVN